MLPPVDARRTGERVFDESDINLGAADADVGSVGELVAQLGAPEYAVRESATDRLARHCPGAFRQLAEYFRDTDDYETRIRIQQVVREQYLWHTLLKHKGFLGVSYQQSAPAALPDGSAGVMINVQPGSAADAGGLRDHDVIVAIDGHGFSTNDAAGAFRTAIQGKGAGSSIRLDLLRNGRPLSLTVSLGARPMRNYDTPELIDELNTRLQAFTLWWSQFFSLPAPRTERTPSTTVLELPE